MKVYINQNFNNRINSYNNQTLPIAKKKSSNISGEAFLIDKFNDYNVNFCAKQSVTKTINAEKTKLLRNLIDLLSTNIPELSAEEKAYKLMRKSIAFAKATAKRVNYLPLTTSLNFLPAEKTGTVLAGILISLPV